MGDKWVEYRRRIHPWKNYWGLLAIHAGLRSDYITPGELNGYPTGHVLAICELAGVVDVELATRCFGHGEVPPDCRYLGWGWPNVKQFLCHPLPHGPFGLVLRNVCRLDEPIPAKGQQGLWNWECPDSVYRAYQAYLETR